MNSVPDALRTPALRAHSGDCGLSYMAKQPTRVLRQNLFCVKSSNRQLSNLYRFSTDRDQTLR